MQPTMGFGCSTARAKRLTRGIILQNEKYGIATKIEYLFINEENDQTNHGKNSNPMINNQCNIN